MFYCMFYFTCDRSLSAHEPAQSISAFVNRQSETKHLRRPTTRETVSVHDVADESEIQYYLQRLDIYV